MPVRPTDPALDGRGSLVKAGWWSMLRTIRYTVTGRSDERNGLIFLVFDDRCQGQSIIMWISIKFFSEVDPETPISISENARLWRIVPVWPFSYFGAGPSSVSPSHSFREPAALQSLSFCDAETIGCQDRANRTELRRPRRERRFQNHLRSTHFLPVSPLTSCILPGGFFVFFNYSDVTDSMVDNRTPPIFLFVVKKT